MKKQFLAVLLMASILFACSKNETAQPNETLINPDTIPEIKHDTIVATLLDTNSNVKHDTILASNLTPAIKTIPWTDLGPSKTITPWTNLTPAKTTTTWTELDPANYTNQNANRIDFLKSQMRFQGGGYLPLSLTPETMNELNKGGKTLNVNSFAMLPGLNDVAFNIRLSSTAQASLIVFGDQPLSFTAGHSMVFGGGNNWIPSLNSITIYGKLHTYTISGLPLYAHGSFNSGYSFPASMFKEEGIKDLLASRETGMIILYEVRDEYGLSHSFGQVFKGKDADRLFYNALELYARVNNIS